jgi:hypothetical protein
MKKNHTFTYGCALLLAAAFTSFCAQAQRNYRPGIVVTAQGDTLHGLIDCKDWDNNPKMISYKNANESAGQRSFSPKDISFFSVENVASFESYHTQISQCRTGGINDLPSIEDTSTVTNDVFLKVIRKGPLVNLYSYSDNIKTRFYIKAAAEKQSEELLYRRYLPEGNGGRIINKEVYKSQLFQLAEKYASANKNKLLPAIQTTVYTLSSMVKIVDLMNGNKVKFKQPLVTKFYAGIALYAGKAKYDGDHELAEGAHSNISMLPGISAGLDWYANPKFGRLVFRLDGSFMPAKFKIKKEMGSNGGYIEHDISRSTFSLSPQVIYYFYNRDAFKFSLGAGISASYSIYGKSTRTENYNLGGSGGKFDYVKEIDLEPFVMSLPVRAGVLLNKRFDIYAQYNIPISAISNYVFYSITVNAAQVGINFVF